MEKLNYELGDILYMKNGLLELIVTNIGKEESTIEYFNGAEFVSKKFKTKVLNRLFKKPKSK